MEATLSHVSQRHKETGVQKMKQSDGLANIPHPVLRKPAGGKIDEIIEMLS
jgi:hypothetical protein